MTELREILLAVTLLQWAMVATLLLAFILCALAIVGLRGEEELESRPLPIPQRPGDYTARHRVDYFEGIDTQGISIWDDPKPS